MSKHILVPVKPTQEMLAEGATAVLEGISRTTAGWVYEAMIASAPEVQMGAMGWQPIETAPMGGAAVLLYYGEDYYVMEGRCFPVRSAFQGRAPSYKWVSAVDMGDLKPTHWMPLPLPPESEP